jgi:hypothetical protein
VLLSQIKYEQEILADPRIDDLLRCINQRYSNGGCLYYGFKPIDQAKFTQAWRSDQKGLNYIVRSFLSSESVRVIAHSLKIPERVPENLSCCWYNGYEFEGAITHAIMRGGAYAQCDFPEETARRLSQNFVSAMTAEQIGQTFVCRIDSPWTEWFYDVAWDSTFIVFQYQRNRMNLFCITDTD